MREKARKIPGTPVLYLHDCTPTLEQPSEASVKHAEETVRKKIEESQDMKRLKASKVEDDPKTRKRKRAGNPNPLSCLKSKKKKPNSAPVVEAKDKESLPAKKNKRGKRKNKMAKEADLKDGK